MLRRPVESAQYLSIRYTERRADAGIEPSVESVGDSYDNALAETPMASSRLRSSIAAALGVEYATREWVVWLNNRRLSEPIGNIPPTEAEANFYATRETENMAA